MTEGRDRDRRVVVAFGSNVGDRHLAIAEAARAVSEFLSDFILSSVIETSPVGAGLEHDPAYLNAVGVGESALQAREIFERLRAIEQGAGRERPYAGAPRTLDLDLILVGDEVIAAPDLQVPHPRFRERLFVLDPLCEVAPDLIDPVSGLSARDLRDAVRKKAGA